MRVLMTGGGTAGHVNPALAIAETIRRNIPDAVIEFVCSKEPEDKTSELVPKAGYKLYRVGIKGAVRPLYSPRNVGVVMRMPVARSHAAKIIKEFKPDIIIGTGGFVCWPVLSAGASMNIPTIVHESNACPGLAVKLLKNKVGKILVNFPDTAKYLGLPPERVICTGNPVMNGFGCGNRKKAREALGLSDNDCYVLTFGGSLGAEFFNKAVLDSALKLIPENKNMKMTVAAGKRYFDSLSEYAKSAGIDSNRFEVLPYIYDMPVRMTAADIIICRAGAMTLTELALTGRAAVIVPSPNVADNHQYKNAKAIADADACLLVEESGFPDGKLTDAISELLENPEKRNRLAAAIKEKFTKADANKNIYAEIEKSLGAIR